MFEKDQLPILGILRGIRKEDIAPITEICINSGLRYVEVTMNTENAPEIISEMKYLSGNKLVIGAGTVLNMVDFELAIKAGASFIVSPSIVEEVINACVHEKIPIFPGALTPTEIHRAWDLGADMVKLFPASLFGPGYIKELKGPFNKIKIIAVGGVNEANIHTYFECSADAAAFGASIFNLKWMREKNYQLVEDKLISLVDSYRKYKQV
jgi:2-dehydro-3-deoxyphosphogluconate aldolase / (4S)-4-hydroxy-2-oxoglutarate aldolase